MTQETAQAQHLGPEASHAIIVEVMPNGMMRVRIEHRWLGSLPAGASREEIVDILLPPTRREGIHASEVTAQIRQMLPAFLMSLGGAPSANDVCTEVSRV